MNCEQLVVVAPHIRLRDRVSASQALLREDVRQVAHHYQVQGWTLDGAGPHDWGAGLQFHRPRIRPLDTVS